MGRFFRSIADAAGRKGEGGATRQGIYLFTAEGTLLGAHNNRSAERHLAAAEAALRAWEALPEEQRKPGAVQIPPLDESKLDPRYHRPLPKDVFVVNVHARALERVPAGQFQACSSSGSESAPVDGPSVDHLWIRKAEWTALIDAAQRNGRAAFPSALAYRILRFHLIDNTRGEPPFWRSSDIRRSRLDLIQTSADRFRIEGDVLLSTEADPGSAERGFDAVFYGEIAGDETRPKRFDLLALGDHWGEGTFTPGSRPGRHPFAIAFTLGRPAGPDYQVPPQGIRWEEEYYEADRR